MAARSARSWNFSKYFWLFQWEKIIFCQNAYFCLKMIFRPCYFYFFFRTLWVGWVGFEKCGKFRTFFFFLKPSLMWLVVSRELNFLIILVFFFLFNRFIWIKQIQLKSTINSNSSMNSLGFLNEFREISQWIHSDSSINSLGFLNKLTQIPQWIH